MRLQISMLFSVSGLNVLSAWYVIICTKNVLVSLYRLVAATNFMAYWTGWEGWNLGLASDKSIVQLASSSCSNWKENNLYAWWYWSLNKSCGTDWESSTANHNGSRLNCSYGFIVVSACLYRYILSLVIKKFICIIDLLVIFI